MAAPKTLWLVGRSTLLLLFLHIIPSENKTALNAKSSGFFFFVASKLGRNRWAKDLLLMGWLQQESLAALHASKKTEEKGSFCARASWLTITNPD
jgi:hypothetical protein